jgi:hypothetical protein
MFGAMWAVIINEEERKRHDADPDYEPFLNVGCLLDGPIWPVLVGAAIGLSPFIFALLLCWLKGN